MNPALETLALAWREYCEAPGKTLFLGAEPHPGIREIIAWQPLKPLADKCVSAGLPFCAVPEGKFRTVLFLPGKSKDEILAGFARGHDLLEPGGRLVVALANTAGAARFEKELSKAAPLIFSISKHKCRAFAVSNSVHWDAAVVDGWRELSRPRLIPETNFIVRPGVFSANRIDPGSALLAEHIPRTLRGCVADLGAGWGYLSKVALGKSPGISRINLFEADSRALTCAESNVAGNAAFNWHDVTTGLPERYDHILMNPPFHTAQSKDVDLGKAFLSVAAGSLKRGGSMYLVANRQLPYEAHMLAIGLRPRILAENHAYKVIVA